MILMGSPVCHCEHMKTKGQAWCQSPHQSCLRKSVLCFTRLASWPLNGFPVLSYHLSHQKRVSMTDMFYHVCLYVGFGNGNSSPHACRVLNPQSHHLIPRHCFLKPLQLDLGFSMYL